MDAQPFKFRHVNRLVGAFIFVALIIAALIFGLAGKAQKWFTPSSNYRVVMPKEGGTRGIAVGSDVRVFGNHVGHVEKVDLVRLPDLTPVTSFEGIRPTDLEIVAVLSVKGDFAHFIGADSKAVLKHDLHGLGSAFFDITRGTGIRDRTDDVLAFDFEEDVKKEMVDIITELKNVAVPAVREVERASGKTADLVARLAEDDGDLFTSLGTMNANLERLTTIIEMIEKGEGAIGLLLRDEATRTGISDSITQLGRSMEKLDIAMERVDATFGNLDTGILSLNEAAEALPGILENTDDTITRYGDASTQLSEVLREAEILTEGLQRHWLVRKYIEDPIEDPQPSGDTTKSTPADSNRSNRPATSRWKH